MKTRKWLWWTLGILASLALLAGAGFAGYRIGLMQRAQSSDNPHAFMFNNMDRFHDKIQGHPGFGGDMSQFHQGNRFDIGRRGFSHSRGLFFPSIFGLVRIAFWVFLFWLTYMIFTRSGWRLVRESPPKVEVVEEKKPRTSKKSS